MTDFLLDTNHVSRFLADDPTLEGRLQASQGTGNRFGISMTVLGELDYAAYASQRQVDPSNGCSNRGCSPTTRIDGPKRRYTLHLG